MNLVVLCGRLTANVEIRMTQNNKKVASFTLAIDNGRDKPAEFIDCVAWENRAEFLGLYTQKGVRILVTGHLKKDTFEKDGQKHYRTTVIADRIEFADGRQDTKPVQPSVVKPRNNVAQPVEVNGGLQFDSDDLPF